MTKKAPETLAPQVPGMITHAVDTAGLARDFVAQACKRLTEVHGCLCAEHEGTLTVFAPQACGPEFGEFARKMFDGLKLDQEGFQEVGETFPRPINQRAQENVRNVLYTLSATTIGSTKGPHILDLVVDAHGWRGLVRTRGTGLMHGAQYQTLLDRVRGTIRAAILSAYANPF